MPPIRATTTIKVKLTWSGSQAGFIELADNMASARQGEGFGLDSLDAGDAFGFFIQELMRQGDLLIHTEAGTLIATQEQDTYKWEGLES